MSSEGVRGDPMVAAGSEVKLILGRAREEVKSVRDATNAEARRVLMEAQAEADRHGHRRAEDVIAVSHAMAESTAKAAALLRLLADGVSRAAEELREEVARDQSRWHPGYNVFAGQGPMDGKESERE